MLSMTQAAKTIGRSKLTLMRDIKNGRLSATRTSNGRGDWEIDPAELHRVYTPPVLAEITEPDFANGTRPIQTTETLLRELLADREATIADLRIRLDREADERREAQAKLTALLTDQRKEVLITPAPPSPKPWWKRLLLS